MELLTNDKIELIKNKKTLSGKYKKATKNIFTKNEKIYKKKKKKINLFRTSFLKKPTFSKMQKSKLKRSSSCICLNTCIKLELDIKDLNYNNNELKEYGVEISLTEKNYIFRELLQHREIDYIETFGKMIGEDSLIQNLQNRLYGAETLTKCILGFLTSNDYHILFDKINSINKANIISFLYNVNYFNNKNNFVHKLYRGIKTVLFSKGKYIYMQNEPFRNMFIIKKGNVNINIIKVIKVEADINLDLILGKKIKIINHINDIKQIEHFTCDRIFELRGEYYEKKIYTIVNYGEGEILGNLEHFGKIPNYICSAQCISNVELYEIDINLYKKIESNENIEFLSKKTKKQLEFFKKRIKEINLIHKKNNKEYYIGKNKFMKAYYHHNPALPLKEKEKEYINDSKNPFPIKIKLKKKKLKNTKISPFSSQDFESLGIEDKNDLNINSERSINNNIIISQKHLKKMDEKPNIIFNDKYYFDKNKDKNMSIINSKVNDNNIKFNLTKNHNKTRYKTLSALRNEKNKKEKNFFKKKKNEFDYSKIFASNEFSKFFSFSSLSPKDHQRKTDRINLFGNINNNIFKKKKTINFRTPPREKFFLSNSNISVNANSPKNNINIITNLKEHPKLNLKEENEEYDIMQKEKVSEKI